jgi:hypothetical protein
VSEPDGPGGAVDDRHPRLGAHLQRRGLGARVADARAFEGIPDDFPVAGEGPEPVDSFRQANSSISYEIEYGALDTLYSQKALSKDKGIDCRLELQDVDNGGTLKILDRFSLDKLSMRGIDGSSRKLSGSLELRKFAGRNLRLKLVIEDGINARWGLMERVLNAEDEKEIEKITSEKVSDYSLSQNYPNPFNPTTVINYQIPRASKVTLKVYDLLGKEVATLVDEVKSEGKYSVEFNASSLPSGIYLYEIRANEFVKSGKMMLLK